MDNLTASEERLREFLLAEEPELPAWGIDIMLTSYREIQRTKKRQARCRRCGATEGLVNGACKNWIVCNQRKKRRWLDPSIPDWALLDFELAQRKHPAK